MLFVVLGGSSLEARMSLPQRGNYSYSLKKFQTKKNVVLVFAKNSNDPTFVRQKEAWKDRYADFRKSDVVLFYVFESGEGRAGNEVLREIDSQDLRKAYKAKSGDFQILYIDKQGKQRRSASQIIATDKLAKFLKG